MNHYRIEFTITRRQDGEDDFTEVGFGSSTSWSTVYAAAHEVESLIQNQEWETRPGMPEPDELT
jgi:hypothetical protein